ncbi:hypothetical protein ACROYT_G039049 [Oculina patagonica]
MDINEFPAMEIHKSPAAFQHVIANHRTARDFTEACAYCLVPLAPSFKNNSLVLCENCEQRWHDEKQPEQESDAAEIPLSSTDISLTLGSSSDEETENPAFVQADREVNLKRLFLRVEEELRRDESEDLNHSLLNEEDPPPKNRIIEILKACGFVVIGVPLIAGVGAVSIVVITVAGALSPPVLLAIAKHRKYTSNQWWTYTRKQRFLATCWGAFVGTVMLPLLAPWGIYKLFKFLGTKLAHRSIYWMRLLESRRDGSIEDGTDESFSDWQMESVCAHQAEAHIVLDREETNKGSYQSIVDQDLDKPQTGLSQPISPGAASYNDGLEDNCYVNENAEEVKRVQAILGSIEEDEEPTDLEVSCHECRLLALKTSNGRNALSDEESDCGRRDTQRLWPRKVISQTSFSVKIPNEELKERKLVSGLDESLCPHHQRQKETDQIVNNMKDNLNTVSDMQREALQILDEREKNFDSGDKEVADGTLPERFPQNTNEGAKRSGSPQCQKMKDLLENGPKKKKRRRKRRTGKQLVAETQDSSPASEANETAHEEELEQGTPLKESQLQQSNTKTEAKKGKMAELQAGKTTPQKTRKAGPRAQVETLHKDELGQGTPRKQSQLLQTNTNTEDEKEKVAELQAGKTTPCKTRKPGKPAQEMTGEKDKNIKRKTKTPKGKLSTEKTPKTEKNKEEEEQTEQTVPRGARRKLACRLDADSPKKNRSEGRDCPEQKSHKAQSRMTSKAVEAEKETIQREKLPSPASSERDLIALYDDIDY